MTLGSFYNFADDNILSVFATTTVSRFIKILESESEVGIIRTGTTCNKISCYMRESCVRKINFTLKIVVVINNRFSLSIIRN